jgi:predicted O-methyltransferase YrrM
MKSIVRALRHLVPASARPTHYLYSLVTSAANGRVMTGPFAGLKYGPRAVCGAYLPRLVGCYEKELHPVLEELVRLRFETIVDIGAAEGYYACGLALRFPESRVLAFEADGDARELLREMADENGLVGRIEIRGFCDEPALVASLDPEKAALILCDCEGHEAEIMTPGVVARLANTHVIIETHDFVRPGVHAMLTARLAATHHVLEIQQQPRTLADWPVKSLACRLLPERRVLHELREGRPKDLAWIYARPRSGACPNPAAPFAGHSTALTR